MTDSAPTTYDEIPYESLAFAQTHPDRLATVARMFGLAPPHISTARVLELGCASGANLIPMAFNLPDAEFVGIDLSRKQVQQAHEIIAALGVRNVTVRHASILDVDQGWGTFDYIICHGVFSWVEPHVQDRILGIAAENLSAHGVAYVSYNTYPGWHMREMVRHMMRYHAGRFDEPAEQIEQARALLHFLASVSDETEPYGQLLSREVEQLRQSPDSYLYHEHLEQTNVPMYFHQFIDRAARAGLQYLSEAEVSDMLTALLPKPVAETLERISPDILHLEQYIDFVRNRPFRQTLLCHKDARPKRALSPTLLHGLMVSCRAVTEPAPPDLTSMQTVVFKKGPKRAEVALPASKAAFTVLMEEWPRAIDVDELCAKALERALPYLGETSVSDARTAMMTDLFGGVVHGMIQLHTQAPPCTKRPSDKPRANTFAAHQARTGNVVVNAHHHMIELEALGVEVLKLANGQRRRGDILDALIQGVASGTILLDNFGDTATNDEALRRKLLAEIDKTLTSLARSAVLVD